MVMRNTSWVPTAGRAVLATAALTFGTATPAAAQVYIQNTPIDAIVPLLYSRGRNESVTERPRPEVNPVGVPVGGFTLYPSVTTQVGFTDNVYQTDADRRSDAFVRLTPQALLRSRWSVNSLELQANGDFLRYSKESARNEDGWSVAGRGRYDISPDISVNAAAETARLFETQFTGASFVNARSITPYQRTQGRLLGDARLGRVRLVAAGDYSYYNYQSVRGFDGSLISQDGRDRSVTRAAGQVEYGITPDTGAFVQVSYTNTDYRLEQTFGAPARSSNEVRALAGVTFDLTALVRGSLGVGYINRDFSSAAYASASGFSLDARVEYFPTPLTTATFAVNRTVQDATFNTGGFFNTTFAARVDHELLRTLILSLGASHESDTFVGVDGSANIDRVSGGARYLANRLLSGRFDLSYARRRSTFIDTTGPRLSEFRALLGITVHP